MAVLGSALATCVAAALAVPVLAAAQDYNV